MKKYCLILYMKRILLDDKFALYYLVFAKIL